MQLLWFSITSYEHPESIGKFHQFDGANIYFQFAAEFRAINKGRYDMVMNEKLPDVTITNIPHELFGQTNTYLF